MGRVTWRIQGLVVVQAAVGLRGFEAVLDGPAQPHHAHDLADRDAGAGMDRELGGLGRVADGADVSSRSLCFLAVHLREHRRRIGSRCRLLAGSSALAHLSAYTRTWL